MQGTLTQRVARGIIWGQAGSVLRMALTVVFSLLVVRYLGPARYGEYALIMGLASTSLVFVSLGLGQALGRFIPELRVQNPAHARTFLADSLMVRLFAGLVVASLILSLHRRLGQLIGLPDESWWAWMLALLLILNGLVELLRKFMTAALRTKEMALIDAGAIALACIGMLVAWLVSSPAINVVLFLGIGMLLVNLVSYLWATARDIDFSGARVGYRAIAWFALTVWGTTIVTFGLENQIDVLLMGYLLHDAVQVGYYAIGTTILLRIAGVLVSSWLSLVLPTFSEVKARNGLPGLIAAWQAYMKLMILLSVPVFVFMVVRASPVIQLLAGDAYSPASTVVSVFAAYQVGASFMGLGICAHFLFTIGYERLDFVLRIGAAALNIILDLILIPGLGALGAVLATVAANLLILSVELTLVLGCFRAAYPLGFAAKVAAGSFISIACVAGVGRAIPGADALIPGVIIYGALMLVWVKLARLISREEYQSLSKPGTIWAKFAWILS